MDQVCMPARQSRGRSPYSPCLSEAEQPDIRHARLEPHECGKAAAVGPPSGMVEHKAMNTQSGSSKGWFLG
jgi:hypothetical protein